MKTILVGILKVINSITLGDVVSVTVIGIFLVGLILLVIMSFKQESPKGKQVIN
jgi:hypothetical protein